MLSATRTLFHWHDLETQTLQEELINTKIRHKRINTINVCLWGSMEICRLCGRLPALLDLVIRFTFVSRENVFLSLSLAV